MQDAMVEADEFRTHIARWVDERLVPQAEALDREGTFPRALFRELGELGYFGAMYPEDQGGGGLRHPYTCFTVLCEELARGSMGFAAGVCMQGSTATNTIHEWGSQKLKDLYLRPALRGEKIGAFAITEPNAGSDAASLRTKAVKVDGGWRLNGSKIFTTNGTVADFITVVASTAPGTGARALEMFVVDTKSDGFSVGRRLDKFSVHCSDTAELVFQDVFVPDDHHLEAGSGGGFLNVYKSLTGDRIFTAALALGTGRATYEASASLCERPRAVRATNREVPGRAIQARRHAPQTWNRAGWTTNHLLILPTGGNPLQPRRPRPKHRCRGCHKVWPKEIVPLRGLRV